ncbi:hypothetical protein CsatA_028814 [Cannabis sativa]
MEFCQEHEDLDVEEFNNNNNNNNSVRLKTPSLNPPNNNNFSYRDALCLNLSSNKFVQLDEMNMKKLISMEEEIMATPRNCCCVESCFRNDVDIDTLKTELDKLIVEWKRRSDERSSWFCLRH